MSRPSHPKKEVEEVLRHAEAQGWRVVVGGSHAWGRAIVLITMRTAAAVSSALRRYGARQRTLAITREHCGALWTIALRIVIGAKLMTVLRTRKWNTPLP